MHFGCTTEDINNLAYALMLREARTPPAPAVHWASSYDACFRVAHPDADDAMLARTHGQPATPTTLGKEIANFSHRLPSANTGS